MSFRKKISRFLNRMRAHKETVVPAQDSSFVEHPIVSSQERESEVSNDANYELILYGRPSCPYCARVNRVIEELGLEEKIIRRRTTYGYQWRTDLQNKTGRTQVPCLFINGEAMFESLDIIDWMRSNL